MGLRILAIDVGVGTQDILLYDDKNRPENNIKLVLPSPTQILAKKVMTSKNDILFTGETMGGGPISIAITDHVKRGFKVVMTERSARTIRDGLEEVRKLGVEIIEEEEVPDYAGYEQLETKDVDFGLLKAIFGSIGEPFEFDFVGIAVQDHGYSEGKSDRTFRFERIKEILDRGGGLNDFAHRDPPSYLTRMCAVMRIAKEHFEDVIVLDTKIAAIAGAIHGVEERPLISIDVGNGHTLGALVGEENLGMFEHHTSCLTQKKLEEMIIRFANGDLTNEEVFNDGGHGCYIGEGVGIKNVSKIVVTGPNRGLMEGSKLGLEYPNPMGDFMMTGAMGIVDIVKENFCL
ncbi:MAG: DUF1786 domain-containing protein [Candidatus Hydrothermarchaeales archaeon]